MGHGALRPSVSTDLIEECWKSNNSLEVDELATCQSFGIAAVEAAQYYDSKHIVHQSAVFRDHGLQYSCWLVFLG